MTNPILSEIYDIRRQILAEHEDDLGDYLHAELERQRPMVTRSRRSSREQSDAPERRSRADSQVENQSSPPGDR